MTCSLKILSNGDICVIEMDQNLLIFSPIEFVSPVRLFNTFYQVCCWADPSSLASLLVASLKIKSLNKNGNHRTRTFNQLDTYY